jgi:hypothetical protein
MTDQHWFNICLVKTEELDPSPLQDQPCCRIRYTDIAKLKVQIISPLKVRIIIHDEVDRDEFSNIGDMKPPGANSHNALAGVYKVPRLEHIPRQLRVAPKRPLHPSHIRSGSSRTLEAVGIERLSIFVSRFVAHGFMLVELHDLSLGTV